MTLRRDDCWPRLESVIKWSNMTTNHFARHIGLLRGENLYQIKRGNNRISRKLAEMIVSTFPEINLLWLLSGEGDMFKEESTLSTQVNYYEVDAECEIRQIDILEPKSKLMLPGAIDADFAMIYRGSAMHPSIPINSTVMLKRVEPNAIIPGSDYLIQTRGIATLRTIRRLSPEAQNSMLRLVANNNEQYDDIFIEESQIERLYKVVAKLIINN